MRSDRRHIGLWSLCDAMKGARVILETKKFDAKIRIQAENLN